MRRNIIISKNLGFNLLKSVNSKKAIGPVVATALLLVVAVAAVLGFQGWFQTYQSGVNSKVEIQSNTNLGNTQIETLVGNTLYFKNGGTDNITINSVKIGGIDCNISKNISSGMSSLNVTNCLNNLTTSTPDIVVFTNNGIYQEKTYIKSITSSTQSVSAPIIPRTGLILEYLFENSVNDTSGNNYNGVLQGASFVSGKVGNALSLQTGNVTLPYIAPFQNYSISFWYKKLGAHDYFLDFHDGNTGIHNQVYFRSVGGNSPEFIVYDSNYNKNVISGVDNYPTSHGASMEFTGSGDGNWHHLLVRNNGNNCEGFIDNIKVFEFNFPGLVMQFRMDALRGFKESSVEIDNLRIYNSSLNSTEIQILSNE